MIENQTWPLIISETNLYVITVFVSALRFDERIKPISKTIMLGHISSQFSYNNGFSDNFTHGISFRIIVKDIL